jgi:uncharacterized protein YidB (DUF937 family)
MGLDDLIKETAGGKGGGSLGDLLGGLAGGGGGDALTDILGKVTGGGGQAGGMGSLLTGLVPMLGTMLSGGGLQKVLASLQANGLGAQAASWLGTGENEPISGADVRKVVGDEELAKIAGELGVSEDEAATAVAKALPAVVDHVSPDGQLPPEKELDSALGQLGGSRPAG